MQSNRLSMVQAGLVLATGLMLAGCSNTPKDVTVGWSPEKIYSQAKEEADNGAWDKAIGMFEKLEGRAAGTVLAQQAQIDKAFAQYKTGDKLEAVATPVRFIRVNPNPPAVE
jgi:outer membrane protein assembly factor BamD